jgi:superfamily II DNA or RNA helicase
MGAAYSKPKQVHNTVSGYEKHCLGKKTLVFNCNVAHSKLVCEAFIEAGHNCRHLDATSADRESTIDWFNATPDAILCNVGILTTGFDSPAVECVIMNKATLSLPLWLQCTGRGSRPSPGKSHFTILDLGGNAMYHGDWCASRDWSDIFHNPDKPGKGDGVAPVKECVQCEAIIPASANVCKFCGADNSKPMEIDETPVEFELLKSSSIDVAAVIEEGAGTKRLLQHAPAQDTYCL